MKAKVYPEYKRIFIVQGSVGDYDYPLEIWDTYLFVSADESLYTADFKYKPMDRGFKVAITRFTLMHMLKFKALN